MWIQQSGVCFLIHWHLWRSRFNSKPSWQPQLQSSHHPHANCPSSSSSSSILFSCNECIVKRMIFNLKFNCCSNSSWIAIWPLGHTVKDAHPLTTFTFTIDECGITKCTAHSIVDSGMESRYRCVLCAILFNTESERERESEQWVRSMWYNSMQFHDDARSVCARGCSSPISPTRNRKIFRKHSKQVGERATSMCNDCIKNWEANRSECLVIVNNATAIWLTPSQVNANKNISGDILIKSYSSRTSRIVFNILGRFSSCFMAEIVYRCY